MSDPTHEKTQKWTLFGSIGAAVGAAICCLGPVVLVSLGVTGAWIGELSALEPYRPIFMVVAAGLLGFAFYRVYGPGERAMKPADDCADGESCEMPAAGRANRVVLWIASVVVVGLFASPYVLNASPSSSAISDDSADSRGVDEDSSREGTASGRAVLRIEGMTCGGCARTVTSALEDVAGVREARVTLEPPRATVEFDRNDVTVEEIARATSEIGFEATPRK